MAPSRAALTIKFHANMSRDSYILHMVQNIFPVNYTKHYLKDFKVILEVFVTKYFFGKLEKKLTFFYLLNCTLK